MTQMYLFSQNKLPTNFVYPSAFLSLIEDSSCLEQGSWWLIAEDPGYADLCLQVIQSKGGSKPLIPFAKDDEYGDLACFDGTDTTGDPRVYFDTGEADYADINWETRHSQSFAEWLATACQHCR